MNSFTSVALEADERIVFGPVTTTKNFSVGNAATQQQFTQATGYTTGVTTRRVIIEDLKDPGKTIIIPNEQIRKVFITARQQQGQATLTLEKVESASGQVVKLDLKGLPAQAETTVKEIFPQAEAIQGKGGPSKGLIIAGVVAAVLVCVLCVLPFVVPLILRLFR